MELLLLGYLIKYFRTLQFLSYGKNSFEIVGLSIFLPDSSYKDNK